MCKQYVKNCFKVIAISLILSGFFVEGIKVRAEESRKESTVDKVVDANGEEREIIRYIVKDGKTEVFDGIYDIKSENSEENIVNVQNRSSYIRADAMASGQCGESLYWNLSDDGVMTISGEGAMWDFRNDASYFDYHFCPWESYKQQIYHVVFESGITYIGADAFHSCESLKNVTFCGTITAIGPFAFRYCKSLENFILPPNLQSIQQEAFSFCTSMTSITIPDSVTFLDASICAFDDELTYAYIGGSKNAGMYINSNAPFRCCEKLEYIHVSPDNIALTEKDGVLYNKEMTELIEYPAGKKDKSYTVESTTMAIFQFAIENALYLEEIILPEGLETLGDIVFWHCKSLKSLTIPSTVTYIADPPGIGCSQLAYIKNNSVVPIDIDYWLGGGYIWVNDAGEYIYSIKQETAYIHNVIGTIRMPSQKSLTVGETAQLSLYCDYWGGDSNVIPNIEDLSFVSSNPSVAEINNQGIVTALSFGTAEVTVAGKYDFSKYDLEGRPPAVATCMITVPCTHNYKFVTVKSTLSKNGKVYEECTICGEKRDNTVIYHPDKIGLSKTNYIYDGKKKKPAVTVMGSDGKIISSSNYKVEYANNKNVGTATVRVTFKGNYSGAATKTFTIIPKGTSLSGVTPRRKGFIVKWRKQNKFTTGYQLQYSTRKEFTKKTTIIKTIKKNSSTNLEVKKLKAKKKYYIRIRTYKTVKGKKYYSSWSKRKGVQTKK